MKVLGIETSCDETGVALVEDGGHILSNVVASQVELHARYGGVVPEVASRQHLLTLLPLLRTGLEQAGYRPGGRPAGLGAVAVTFGPGLAGALLVGLNLAKALAWAWDLPLIGVNHLEAHIYAAWLDRPAREQPQFPLLALVVSGGHTEILFVPEHGQYRMVGRTRDDAAGEAFDKVARVLGLPFPGGPAVEQAARGVTPGPRLPRPWLRGSDDFSFSGLKTAVLRLAESADYDPRAMPGVAAAFQEAVVEVLAAKAAAVARRHRVRCLVMAGGVAANQRLRQAVTAAVPLPVICPPISLCTDNGAMVAAAGYFRLQRGERHGWDLDVVPTLRLV
ncbi:MAG: tRNA (adenosine(37)-N6)-threonylcarbamoyltransferase complex transferase subunit TsaD [Chloroflexi bacterium]|nr:tRNA (adenosine(37)-N6)-threonylcarbamoyltransferase complex transferase subunit TsaD [Chloroflexota bacterium]